MTAGPRSFVVSVAALALVLVGPLGAQVPVPDNDGVYRWRWRDDAGRAREYDLVLPGQIAPAIVATVTTTDNRFVLDYEIANRPRARQRVFACAVDVAVPTSVVASPPLWLSSGPFDGMPQVNWYMGVTGPAGEVLGIEPGTRLSGFRLVTSALPGVAAFSCASDVEAAGAPADLPRWIERQVMTLPLSARVSGTTVGPAINTDGAAIDVIALRVVRNYRQAVVAIGPAAAPLVRGLDAVRAAFTAKQMPAARTALRNLARDLERTSAELESAPLLRALLICVEYLQMRIAEV